MKPLSALVGFTLIISGLIGLYLWKNGEFTEESAQATLAISVLSFFAGMHFSLLAIGVTLFDEVDTGVSGSTWFDGDGGGDSGD